MESPILVLGMHRSGTSLITHIVESWGASVGLYSNLIQPDLHNQHGYWEYSPLVDFNNQALSMMDASWVLPPTQARASRALLDHRPTRRRASNLIQHMYNFPAPWVWKDPRLCLLLPFWQPLLHNPRYIIITRNPQEISLSLQRRNSLPTSGGILLWEVYMARLLDFDLPAEQCFYLSYEQLLAAPFQTCSELGRFLDPNKANSYTSTSVTVQRMVSNIIQPGSTTRRAEPALRLANSQLILREHLLQLCSDRSVLVSESSWERQIYPGWRDYLGLWSFAQTFSQRLIYLGKG